MKATAANARNFVVSFCRILIGLAVLTGHQPGWAQKAQPESLEVVHRVKPVPGRTQMFEQALVEHLVWLREQGDAWRWNSWEVIVGQDTGSYVIRSGGHAWSEFDGRGSLERRSAARWAQDVAPSVESMVSEIYLQRADISRKNENLEDATLLSTNRLLVKYDRFADFSSILAPLAQAMKSSEYVFFRWQMLLNGGEQYILSFDFPKRTWADNLPQTPFWSMVADVHGEAEAERMRRIWFESIVKHDTGMDLYRDDLSSRP